MTKRPLTRGIRRRQPSRTAADEGEGRGKKEEATACEEEERAPCSACGRGGSMHLLPSRLGGPSVLVSPAASRWPISTAVHPHRPAHVAREFSAEEQWCAARGPTLEVEDSNGREGGSVCACSQATILAEAASRSAHKNERCAPLWDGVTDSIGSVEINIKVTTAPRLHKCYIISHLCSHFHVDFTPYSSLPSGQSIAVVALSPPAGTGLGGVTLAVSSG